VALDRRLAGVLLHPTSLPGSHGIGDLGHEAVRFLDWLHSAGFGLWQVLPLGPTGFGDSPYQCFSAFAGNPYLISPDLLVEQGLLTPAEARTPRLPADRVDYGPVIEHKMTLLRRAFERFRGGDFAAMRRRLTAFRRRETVAAWLDDYALFAALKKAHGGAVWNTWDKPLRKAQPRALEAARRQHADEIDFQVFIQFLFFDQWHALRAHAHQRGIQIVGDLPIYVAFDSADTWAHQELFKLTPEGQPTCVAGVPPDYFSATGQLWGNPIYRYDKMKRRGFRWWIGRMRSMLEMFDIVRLDHFRGFEAYWEVPAGEKTAVNGKWVPGPRHALFEALRNALGGDLPLIAENLGVITDQVEELREHFGLPGMKVLQFAWVPAGERPLVPDPGCVFQPHKVERRCVVYTGSHDNPTTRQWWDEFASPGERRLMQAYLGCDGRQPHEDLCRAALATTADTVILPMQDLLGLGGEARMNFPGREAGNWGWRMAKGAATAGLARRWREALLIYERHADQDGIARGLLARQTAADRARKP
jgi:4-alpha-glucanotransferase